MAMRNPRLGLSALAGLVGVALSLSTAEAGTRVHALVIGNNQAPTEQTEAVASQPTLTPLRFADDDAAAFFELVGAVTGDAHLLTAMDRETQSLYPDLVQVARPPTMKEVRAAVSAIATTIEKDHGAGDRATLYVFFSGHGSVIDGKSPSLALLGGGITQEILYDEILGRLPADTVHLFVDACHAEAIVRPRDTQAQVVAVAPSDAHALLMRSTLARFPHVGAVVAAASNAPSHEWDLFRHGVFTHELLSGLRGGADVNGDHKIEYSEIYAFLGAANRKVVDARARLSIIARAPETDRRAVLWDLDLPAKERVARLTGIPGRIGLIRIEDDSGRLLASLHGEPGFTAELTVPATAMYVRAGAGEARVEARPGALIPFNSLSFRRPSERQRGSLDDALRRGLFANAFGPNYYNGFVDQTPDFVPVIFASESSGADAVTVSVGETDSLAVRATPMPPIGTDRPGRPRLLLGLGASTAVAREFRTTGGLRIGVRPSSALRGPTALVDFFRASQAGLIESRLIASAGWFGARRRGRFEGWLGASAGGGAVVQQIEGAASRWSGILAAGPFAGVAADVTRRFNVWLEAQLWGLAYRRDGQSTIAASPAAWLGVSLDL